MSGLNKPGFLTQAASSLLRIRARTWLILASVGVLVVGLLAWAAIAVLSWLWAQAPAATDTGKRLAGEAATRIEQAAPGLREQAEQWVPDLTDRLQPWLPGEELPARDVSGADVGPVPRYPGLVRSHFAREGQAVEAGYAGRAALDSVLAHYVQGFAAAGYVQEVMSATSGGEQHRFRRGQEAIDLSLTRRPGGLVELRLQQSSSQ